MFWPLNIRESAGDISWELLWCKLISFHFLLSPGKYVKFPLPSPAPSLALTLITEDND